jgi:tetratricopeptide (TPR) repeat protein
MARRNGTLVAGLVALLLASPGLAQEAIASGPSGPAIHPAVAARLGASYLTDEDRRDLRVEYGVWEEGDLDTPARRARAALIAGAFSSSVLDDPAAPVLDRAEAMLRRGLPERALELLGEPSTLRAARMRAEALFDLGRFDEADAAIQPVVDRLVSARVEDPAELADGVTALMLRATMQGSQKARGGDYRTLTRILDGARNELDRLSWRVRLVEATLLGEKNNRADASEAIAEAMALNPRCAAALRLLAEFAVDSFAFDDAETMADQLDELAGLFGAPSIDAALVRARLRLRQRDTAGASEAIAEMRGLFPGHRGLLAMDAAIAAASFDQARSEALLAEFQRLAPGSPIAEYEAGRTLADARQYEEAVDLLRVASGRLENWSAPWTELGLVLIQAGRDAEAGPVLETAVELDPFNARAANSLELVRGLAEFTTIESDHFVVRYLPGIDELLAREMLPVLERIHSRVTADPERVPGGVGHEPPERTLIELMPSHRWFSVRITGMTRIHTMAAATGPVIAMESPQEGPDFTVGPFDWPRVIQHEYTHTVTLSRTRNRIPHWFTEAVAVFNEDAPRDERTWRLLARAVDTGTLFDLRQINTAFVRPEKPTDRAQAYAQGHWMVEFIVDRWGPRAPVALMDRSARGEPEASAIEAELGVSAEEFQREFKEWARADLRRVGLLVPDETPTLTEMLDADRREADDPDSVRPDAAFLDRWRSRHPDHPQLAELGVALLLGERPDNEATVLEPELIRALEDLARLLPVAEQPHSLLARHFLAGETPWLAIPHLEFLDAREQHAANFAARLARLYADRGEWSAAAAKAERAATIAPFDADAREFAARVALKNALDGDRSRYADAERHILALTLIEPQVALHQQRLERVRAMAQP